MAKAKIKTGSVIIATVSNVIGGVKGVSKKGTSWHLSNLLCKHRDQQLVASAWVKPSEAINLVGSELQLKLAERTVDGKVRQQWTVRTEASPNEEDYTLV